MWQPVSPDLETGEDGNFWYSPAPVGEYKVEAESKGFKKSVASGIVVRAHERARLDLVLEVGIATQVVEVSSQGRWSKAPRLRSPPWLTPTA